MDRLTVSSSALLFMPPQSNRRSFMSVSSERPAAPGSEATRSVNQRSPPRSHADTAATTSSKTRAVSSPPESLSTSASAPSGGAGAASGSIPYSPCGTVMGVPNLSSHRIASPCTVNENAPPSDELPPRAFQ